MKLIRIRRISGVDVIKPFLTENLELTREQLASALKFYISESPDEIFLMAGFEESELKAFVVAIREPGKKNGLLLQLWVMAKQEKLGPKQIADSLMRRVFLWAEELGLDEVRYEDKIGVLSEVHRWNFQPYSQVMTFRLVDGYEKEMVREGDHDPITYSEPTDEIEEVNEIEALEKGISDGISKLEGRENAPTTDDIKPAGEVLLGSAGTGPSTDAGTAPGTP